MRYVLSLFLFFGTLTGLFAQSTIHQDWEKLFGGGYQDQAKSVISSGDGGYILVGWTKSSGAGGKDAYVVKVSASGDKLWEKTFGKESDDFANAAVLSPEGNYVIAGTTFSKQNGYFYWWVLALDKAGNKIWENTYGGSEFDDAKAMVATADGYAIVGVRKNAGDQNKEMSIMKINKKGAKAWEYPFGIRYYENEATAIAATPDEGFIIAGWSKKNEGPKQLYLAKIDKRGNPVWQKPYEGTENDAPSSIGVTSDGRYILAISSRSKTNGEEDIRVIKTDNNGEIEWDHNYGGSQSDQPTALIVTPDNGCIVSGSTKSVNNGKEKAFLLRLDKKGNVTWERFFGSYPQNAAEALITLADGSFVIAGESTPKSGEEQEMLCMKLSDNFEKEVENFIADKVKQGDKRDKEEIRADACNKLRTENGSFSDNVEVAKTEEVMYRGSDPFKGTNVANAAKDIKAGKFYALIIGVDAYSGTWPPLKNAVNDAKALENVLRQKYQFDVFKTLYNTQATRTSIINEFEWLVANTKENDNVLIYYSGHGEFKKELNKGFWVPVDAKTSTTSQFISNSDIQTFLASIPSKHTLLISDACFSGDIFRGTTATLPFENTEKYYVNTYNAKSRQAISSGGIEPVMDGGKEGHSVFAYYLLQALKSNEGKYYDSSQLFNKIKIPVVNNSDQSPNFNPIKNTGDEGGQFLFIKKQ